MHKENQTSNQKPDWKISLVRELPQGHSQWAKIAVGWSWLNDNGEGINFVSDLLKMFGFKIVAQKIEPKE